MPTPASPEPAERAANANIARHLALMATTRPHAPALKIPRGRTSSGAIDYLTLNFAELDAEVSAWCERLAAAGVSRGDRTLVMVRQGLPLIASVFALFRIGAVPIVIDPGMGLKNFLACVTRSQPRALLGIPLARALSRVFWKAFSTVTVRVAARDSMTARLTTAARTAPRNFQTATCSPTELAAILFTSGSTGAPKGVCYEHGMFEAQVRLIRETYAIAPGEIDLPLLPIFALFNPALGMTTIVPEIDPGHPAKVDPAKIVQAIQQEKVTNSFGSPTLWGKIGNHCLKEKIALPSLHRVLCAGAPVPAALWENSRSFLPNGRLHSPYGATEALPVATVSADEIDSASVRGACVGRSVAEIDVRIIAITDAPIAMLADAREMPSGEIGEIIVRGPVVTKAYDALPDSTAAAKIVDGPAVWHRMGDCGYLDSAGRIWFCGRKAERVETAAGPLFTEACEQVFRQHPWVTRCALVGLGQPGQQQPAVVIEAKSKTGRDLDTLARELRGLGVQHAHTAAIQRFYFHPDFPVDVRHNAKIHRLTLAQWAATFQASEEVFVP